MRRIAAENAKLYNVAAVAIREVREETARQKARIQYYPHGKPEPGYWEAIDDLVAQYEDIIDRYDAAISEAIK